MVYVCKVLCASDEADHLEDLGLKDPGVWADLAIEMDYVVALKRSGALPEADNYMYTTVYTEQDTYIVNIPFPKMLSIWTNKTLQDEEPDEINL